MRVEGIECGVGYRALAGTLECTECPAGKNKWWINWDTECAFCQVGTYAPKTKTSRCTECAPGKTSQAIGSTKDTCEPCALGTISSFGWKTDNVEGWSSCQGCEKGNYPVNNKCEWCLVGKYADREGQAECTSCAAGKKSANGVISYSATDTCTTCQGIITSSDTCTDCGAGTFSSSAGASVCTTCTASSCKCLCCKGNSCNAAVAGTFSVSSSSDCGDSACRSNYPEVCPASGSSGTSASAFIAASSVSCNISSSSASAAETLLVTRTSLPSSPAACVQLNSCFTKCSACYTYSVSGNSATLTPGSVSGCTCYAATFGSSGVATFGDGSAATVTVNGCVATVQTQAQGATCTSTYAVTKITGSGTCPPGATTCPSSTYSTSSANSAADGCSIVGMLFSVMAAALVATMSTKTLV